MILTCESLSPSFSANFFLSGLLIYFCIWNRFSRPCRWASENTALLIIPLRGFPLVAHGNPVANDRLAANGRRLFGWSWWWWWFGFVPEWWECAEGRWWSWWLARAFGRRPMCPTAVVTWLFTPWLLINVFDEVIKSVVVLVWTCEPSDSHIEKIRIKRIKNRMKVI